MNYWLIKSEPSVFSIDDMKKVGVDAWNGVRNYQARNFMKQMSAGDLCFFYHSNTKNPGIVGLVKVLKTAYPDPDDIRFVLVQMEYQKHTPLFKLATLKSMLEIRHLALFHQSRLSVQPVDANAAMMILERMHEDRIKH